MKPAEPEAVSERDGGEEARGPKEGSGDEELRELSAGELSALCSNLARGCEKQYRGRSRRCSRSWRITSRQRRLCLRARSSPGFWSGSGGI